MSADSAKRSATPTLLMIGLLVVGLIMYMVILGWRGFQLIASGTAAGIGVGIGVLILPVLGAWMIYSTLAAGSGTSGWWLRPRSWARPRRLRAAATRVGSYRARGSRRVVRAGAHRVGGRPDDWVNTYRIARAYDYAGDRTRARQMMKTAVAQYRAVSGT